MAEEEKAEQDAETFDGQPDPHAEKAELNTDEQEDEDLDEDEDEDEDDNDDEEVIEDTEDRNGDLTNTESVTDILLY